MKFYLYKKKPRPFEMGKPETKNRSKRKQLSKHITTLSVSSAHTQNQFNIIKIIIIMNAQMNIQSICVPEIYLHTFQTQNKKNIEPNCTCVCWRAQCALHMILKLHTQKKNGIFGMVTK